MKNRAGAYKKVIFTIEELTQHSELIFSTINELLELHRAHKLNDQEFTALYLLFFIRLKNPQNYLQRTKHSLLHDDAKELLAIIPQSFQLSDYEKKKLTGVTLKSFFLDFNLKGIPQSINRAMAQWILGNWDIVLSFKIPSAKTLLKHQAINQRILTLIVDDKRLCTHILGKRDPLSFALHDLMHADQFFNHHESLKGQLGFYKLAAELMENSELKDLLNAHPQFKEEFEYVVSDMNAYIIHLLKSFKSCFTRINADQSLANILKQTMTPALIIDEILKLNSAEFNEPLLKNYFESNQEYIK